MALQLDHRRDEKILAVNIQGKLQPDDYRRFAPVVENLIREHGKVDMLVVLRDFEGWTAGALWEDIKFDAKHFNDIGRLGIVGDKKWERGMAIFCKPFTTAEIRFFEPDRLEEAREWVASRRAAQVGVH